jgi:hypothetical protein
LNDVEFSEAWMPVRQFIKPHGRVLDIGCGPRPPFAPCVVIEPLAEQYQLLDSAKAEWWKGVEIHAQPAEHQIPYLSADTIICWNCLDHTIGWKDILSNMLAYGNAQARFAVATDFWPPFEGHPGYDRVEFEVEIDKRFEIIDRREPFGRQLALLMKAK